jgi:hypothetical protein
LRSALLASRETFFPVVLTDLAGLAIPKALKYIRVVQQGSNGFRILIPQQAFYSPAVFIQGTQLLDEQSEEFLLAQTKSLVEIRRVGRVEGDPQEDELAILVIGQLGPLQPAERAVGAQRQVDRVLMPFVALAFFEAGVVHYWLP